MKFNKKTIIPIIILIIIIILLLTMCNSRTPSQTGTNSSPTESSTAASEILLHVIVPDSWQGSYVYTGAPELLGAWPGTATANGQLRISSNIGMVIINDGISLQTAEIHSIDMSQPEVWIVVDENNSYTITYSAPTVPDPEPTEPEPTDPEPTDPEPTETAPTEPEPTETEPTEPAPTEPEENQPATGDSGIFTALAVLFTSACVVTLAAAMMLRNRKESR